MGRWNPTICVYIGHNVVSLTLFTHVVYIVCYTDYHGLPDVAQILTISAIVGEVKQMKPVYIQKMILNK